MTEYSKSPLRTQLGRVRYLGSARHGARHWWLERVLSLVLIPLSIWFVVELVTKLLGADQAALAAWIANPFTALLLTALTIIMFVHTRMGLSVIIEDYVHTEWKKLSLILFKDAAIYAFLGLTLAAIAKLHFIGF